MTTLRVLVGVLVMEIAGGSMLAAQAQTVVYVDADATGAIHDGSSWCAAFLYLQDAFAAAENSGGVVSEIRVAGGVYKADQGANETPGDKAATFHLISGVEVYGGFAGCGAPDPDERDTVFYETILSGDLNGDDGSGGGGGDEPNTGCCPGDGPSTTCNNAECYAAVCARRPSCCPDAWNYSPCRYIAANDLCCDLCTSESYCDNSLHVTTGSGVDATAVLDGFTITRGNANRQSAGANSAGGMKNVGGSPTLVDCKFVENRAIYVGSAMVNLDNSNPMLIDCVFSGNWGSKGGGGMFNSESSPTAINCLFTGNSAHSGGAIRNWPGGNPVLINCTISGNYTGGYNGYGGGLRGDAGAYPTLVNCILWGNTHSTNGNVEHMQIASPGATIDFSCVEGWSGTLGGTNNFGDDPLFVDADGIDDVFGTADDDARLSRGSPYIDAGDNTAVPPFIAIDLDGAPRFVDFLSAPDSGNGTPPFVDFGAYEYLADCNDNDVEDELDIIAGTSDDCDNNLVPDECELDSDNDGLIDVCDPCPQDQYNDADDDGVCAPDDQCPSDPNKAEPGICGCGVSDVDDDGDGVPTCEDVCPGVDDAVFGPNCTDPIPTVSTWGLVTLLLVLLTAGKLCFGRRRLAK